MNVQSTRRARRDAERTRRSGRTAVAGGLAILLLGGMGLGFVVFDTAQQSTSPTVPVECDSSQRVPVVTDQSMAQILRDKPVDPESCIVLDTTEQSENPDSHTEPHQDMSAGSWIPSSSALFPTTSETNRFTVHTESLATSSPVAVAEVQNNTVSKQQLNRAMIARTVSGESGHSTSNEIDLLEASVSQSRNVVVSEKGFLDFVETHPQGDQVRALVPDSGAWLLDYPLLVPSEAARRNETIAQAAQEIATYLGSERGREVLSEHHLRGVDGRRLPDARSAASSHRLQVEDEVPWQRLMTTWSRQTSPHNALYVLDASESMGRENPDADRSYWRTAVDSTVIRTRFIPTRDSVGLWTSPAADGADKPYQQLVPIRRMDEYVHGSPQRQMIQDALAGADFTKDSDSGLYPTALAAFREVQKNFRDGAVNTVVLISDGTDTRGDAEDLNELVRTLKQEQDREKPVYIVTLAITDGEPPQDLKEISEATGGTSHAGGSLQDIQERYLHTLSVF
ncbi:VWA domain-containing protein [Kocuria carniphila]|uniref:VWA domain-containing protein n=1 Tax=Kocuria carniphila TaxID=262208 RepID=UPI0028E6FC66|nr:VWA domain-containing protein [Kocuria carniphila]